MPFGTVTLNDGYEVCASHDPAVLYSGWHQMPAIAFGTGSKWKGQVYAVNILNERFVEAFTLGRDGLCGRSHRGWFLPH